MMSTTTLTLKYRVNRYKCILQQKIISFHQDEFNDWVADLACGHSQHVRHHPPFQNRPWVIHEKTRKQFIGFELNCRECDKE